MFFGYYNQYNSYVKLYSLTIKEEDTIVHDYIPVLDASDRPFLFDKVGKSAIIIKVQVNFYTDK